MQVLRAISRAPAGWIRSVPRACLVTKHKHAKPGEITTRQLLLPSCQMWRRGPSTVDIPMSMLHPCARRLAKVAWARNAPMACHAMHIPHARKRAPFIVAQLGIMRHRVANFLVHRERTMIALPIRIAICIRHVIRLTRSCVEQVLRMPLPHAIIPAHREVLSSVLTPWLVLHTQLVLLRSILPTSIQMKSRHQPPILTSQETLIFVGTHFLKHHHSVLTLVRRG
mmetsp:Transcript_19357/g.42010  ORF Transcript_19357/g.42010 Transcript_19357/m.42010 type:complete len:225 (-) Transcript_19357:6990-7664(-)